MSQVTRQRQRDDDQTAEAAGRQVQRCHRAGRKIPSAAGGEQRLPPLPRHDEAPDLSPDYRDEATAVFVMKKELTAAEMLLCWFQSQRTLKASHDAAMMKVDELSAQLKDERMKSLDLEKRLQSSAVANIRMEQVSAAQHVTLLWSPRRVRAPFHLTSHAHSQGSHDPVCLSVLWFSAAAGATR